MKARVLKVEAFTAGTLTPADPPAGDSLEELVQEWLTAAGEIEFIDFQYRPVAAGEYTATILYTE